MKKVIIESKSFQTVLASQANSEKFYGVVLNQNLRGFITRQGYEKGGWVIAAAGPGLSDGRNYYSSHPAFQENGIEKAIANFTLKYSEIYEFDSFKELALWLINEPEKALKAPVKPKAARKAPLTITDRTGKTHKLSQKKYKVVEPGNRYGRIVRLISGLQGHKKIGFHYSPGWVCTCPVDAFKADWQGFQKIDLVEIKD